MSEVKIDRELSWEDEIVADSQFVILTPGEYPFRVVGFERDRTQGSDKLPPSNMAVVELEVEGQNIKEYLVLHTKMEWKLSSFFVSLGMKKKGEPLRMNWGAIIGKTGRCRIKNEVNNGNTYNKVESFLEPEEQPSGTFNPVGF